ncbi:MAG: hypothetical protein KAI57_02000 [Candidatus Pacebacteria bacterium]|nr:hypothetical protein [Candidatus Paceibacterota bacterium]
MRDNRFLIVAVMILIATLVTLGNIFEISFADMDLWALLFLILLISVIFGIGYEVGESEGRDKSEGMAMSIAKLPDDSYRVTRKPSCIHSNKTGIFCAIRVVLFDESEFSWVEITEDDFPAERLSEVKAHTTIKVKNGKIVKVW